LNFGIAADRRTFSLQYEGKILDVAAFESIWFRRPGTIKSKQFFEAWVATVIESEAEQALKGMLYSLPCLWVNFPMRHDASSLKLFQLEVAKKLGLAIPETVVTSDPKVALAFYEKHDGGVIYKLVTEKSNFYLPRFEFPHGIPTLPVRKADLAHFQQVRHAPHLFQQEIRKQSDIRVTVIGKKVFAFNIESQSGSGKLDWRTDYKVPMKACSLPDEINQGCLNLLKRLGLNYGAIDFCLDQDGQYVFLEINSAGQYLWLEELTEVPLSYEMALLLSGKSDPLVTYEQAAFA
jgi:glutathione synthase/RimK-type ligase-like ATP-grasp enzyme